MQKVSGIAYLTLGWPKAASSHAGFAKFDLGGVVPGIQSRKAFAINANSPTCQSSGFAGFALAYIARSPDGHLFVVLHEDGWIFDQHDSLVS